MTLDSTDLALNRLVEYGEAEAYFDFYSAAPASWEVIVKRIGSAILLLAPQMDVVLFNRVIGLGLGESIRENMVDEILEQYQRAGVRNFAIQVSPAAQPILVEWLATRGLSAQDRWSKVYRTIDPPAIIPTDLRTQRIGQEFAEAFAEVASAAFGMPKDILPWLANHVGRNNWYHYLAFDGDNPVATAALYVRKEVGWLGIGSTLPAYRRRGAQGALMARRITDAAGLGCRWLVTETGEDLPEHPNPSYHNMLRTGFKLAYHRTNYCPPRNMKV